MFDPCFDRKREPGPRVLIRFIGNSVQISVGKVGSVTLTLRWHGITGITAPLQRGAYTRILAFTLAPLPHPRAPPRIIKLIHAERVIHAHRPASNVIDTRLKLYSRGSGVHRR